MAIILLGFSFSLMDIVFVGKNSIVVVMVTVVSRLIITYYIGHLFDLYGTMSWLIGLGTAICGATSIVTLSPIIKAKEKKLTYVVNIIFAFNILTVLTFSLIGTLLNMPDYYYGVWAKATIHDT